NRQQRRNNAKQGCNALTALELEPDRIKVTDHGTGGGELAPIRPKALGDHDGDRAFQSVEDQGRGSETLGTGPENIGGADIAGSDGANVALSAEPRENQPKRDGTEQITDD